MGIRISVKGDKPQEIDLPAVEFAAAVTAINALTYGQVYEYTDPATGLKRGVPVAEIAMLAETKPGALPEGEGHEH